MAAAVAAVQKQDKVMQPEPVAQAVVVLEAIQLVGLEIQVITTKVAAVVEEETTLVLVATVDQELSFFVTQILIQFRIPAVV
jgi:hypothetical protein